MEKVVQNIVHAEHDDIADLVTFRAMPVPGLERIDPFLFLNHHGPQNYVENNHGLPFGPHPHRGFETVTIVLEGDIAHGDSAGNESVITAGGVQWMTAGRGIVHSEVSSDHFRRAGGPLEILQLWINLPARLKMSEPYYLGLHRHQIPSYERDNKRVKVQLISGKWEDNLGPFPTLFPVTTMCLSLQEGADYVFEIPSEDNVFFYVISGEVKVNGRKANLRKTVTFEGAGNLLHLSSEKGTRILLCHARPHKESVVSYGPFVMNTVEEIQKAIHDYQSGKYS
jgi:redox-sensitive bicupin YhaK (pirin superfamily)